MNLAFVWYSLKHLRIHNPTLHFLHFVRMLLSSHMQNRRNNLFSWLRRLAIDVNWLPLVEILYLTEEGVNLWGTVGKEDPLQHAPSCSGQGREENLNVTVSHNRIKLFRIIRFSKWKNSIFVRFQVQQLMQ